MLVTITLVFIGLILSLFLIYIITRPNRRKKPWWVESKIPRLPVEKDRSLPTHEMNYQIYQGMKKLDYKYCVTEGFFGSAVLYLTDLEDIKSVMVSDFSSWVNRTGLDIQNSDPILSKVLQEMRDQNWKDLRSAVTPAYTTGKIRKMYEVFQKSSNNFISYISKESIQKSNQIEFNSSFTKYTMDVIASTAFGLDSQVYAGIENNNFVTMVGRLGMISSWLTKYKFMFYERFPKLYQCLGIPLQKADKEAGDFFINIIRTTMEQREKTGERRNDLLQLMIDAKNHELRGEHGETLVHTVEFTDEVITAQALMFFVNGVASVVIPLMFASYELALQPEIQEELYNEIKEAERRCGGKFDFDTIMKLDYLDRVVTETLRRYPSGTITERQTSKAYEFSSSGLVVEKGTVAAINIYGIHHDPDYYPNPFKFDPDRFKPENKETRHPYTYIPFGMGPRNCLGNRFALAEIKTVLAHLILKFKLEPSEKTLIPMKFIAGGKFTPDGGLWLNVLLRN